MDFCRFYFPTPLIISIQRQLSYALSTAISVPNERIPEHPCDNTFPEITSRFLRIFRYSYTYVHVSFRKGVRAGRIERLYAETAECSLCYLSNRFLTYTPNPPHMGKEGESGEGPSNDMYFRTRIRGSAVCNIHLYARYLYLASVMVDEPSGDGGKWPLVIVIRQVVST